MSEAKLVTKRNEQIAAMLADGEKLKNFYRFIAQNPHINLHDACQIVIERPNATVCYSFNEWAAMDRRVTKGRKGIAYYDNDGYKQFVFDANDTHGDNRYSRPILSMKRLLGGLDELNGTELADSEQNDFKKIQCGVQHYLQEQDALMDDEERDILLIDGIAFSLYSKTGFPNSAGIRLSGLPYDYIENAGFVKEVYVRTDMLVQDIEEAYREKQDDVNVIDDTDEETVSDEPNVVAEQTEQITEKQSKHDEPKHPMYPLYKRYMEAQKEKPQAIVMMRLGDLYEVFGESAVIASKQLDLTLTGRNVGLPERIPMCGIPYHAMDKYLNKILENHSVVLLEDSKEPLYIISRAEALGQSEEAKEEKANPEPTEITAAASTPFDDEQSEMDDWRSELLAELGEMDDGQSELETEIDEGEETDENETDTSSDGQDEQTEQESKPKEKIKSTPKKSEKGIKDRKRKDKPQLSLFDIVEPQEQSREEKLIEYELKRGSHFEHGKFRIFDKYNENPSEKAFAEFLKKEYGEGGSYVGNTDETHNAKGIRLKFKDKEHPENNLDILLKWPNVAVRIADLLDDDNYLTEQEKKEYVEYKVEQNRLREQRAEEERQKNELINKVINSAHADRKQRILDEYANTTKLVDLSEFLKNEYGNSEEQGEGHSVTYNAQGIWIFRGELHDYPNRIYLNWNEFADKVCKLIENDRYIEQIQTQDVAEPLRDLDAEEDEDWDALIDAGILKPAEFTSKTEKPAFNRFKELSAEGKAFLDSYQQRYIREPTNSLWDEVEHCTTIANGIYSVTTAGHGGLMISAELAPHILSPEALKIGDRDGGYYCYEEDAAECIPLRELYDKGILKPTDDYFTHYIIPSELPEAKDGRISFNKATESEKAAFIKRWNKSIDESLARWNGEYWQAHEQTEVHEEKEGGENTDLNSVFDQSELGGAKARFKGNVAAIRLVNKLYSENRNPTESEKKVLSQFVGWGGLSQAFDENNKQWRREYNELKGLLSQEDYEQARGSTLNAYYTAKDVIDGIYAALNRFGVKGNNRILEPSMGTGNFFGFMQKEIADGSRLYGVELDNLTGRIAAKLYPQANVQIKGFEDTSFPNDKFDIVVGNVPFGGYGVADSDYNRYNFRVHDYFLAKSIDKVKPNGIVAIVTSKGTMDKLNPSARKYVAERAELVGAIRLPNTAFKQTAGTEAVADILFFRKREEKLIELSNVDWLGTGNTEEGYEINNYFIKHPEMVLGTLAEEVGLYGGNDITVKPDGRELSEAIAEALNNLPKDFYCVPEITPEAETTIEVDYNVKPMCYKAENGRLYMRIGDEMQEQRIPSFPKDAYQRICGMIALREELHHILDLQIQGCSDEVLEREQRTLNAQYDLFVKRYGELNGQTNTRLFSEDGDSALLLACENIDKETGNISKSDIFIKRTIRPYVMPTSTDDCFEALQISKNERGRVDISYIEELTGKSYEDVLFELGDAVFRNPETTDRTDKYSGFETSEEYLSGKVVAKLNTARRYAEQYPEYRSNVDALGKVQPTPLTASEISVRLGQTWIDKEIYKQFYIELVGVNWWRRSDVELFYNPHDSSWRLDQKDSVRLDTQMKQKEVYGTARAPAYRLFIDCMNLKATTIYDTVQDEEGKERRVLNQAETIAAREKQNKIKEEFANWIFANPERREELEATYNRLFNQIRLPSYDGSYLKFPEMNPAIELRPHQKDAIHRIITNDQSSLLHHVVGSGKTYTMAASIMKMRQLGLCKKAMVAVPNHLVQQWASEWRKLYQNAKILVATKEDLEKSNRQKFVSKVALGDWDGIIIAQSSFAKIPVSKERQIKKLNEEIKSVEETILYTWDEQGMPRGAVKNLEQIKKVKQAQLKKLMDDKNKDDVLTFENLGVDYLYIDEAHYYKNLFLYTKMNNVAGISSAASKRASDLKLKCEYLQELHGSDRGVVFATGTPISNSMTEMYTMQSYLQPSTLKEIGIEFFDGWAANFGETVTSMELAPSGKGYQARTRFAKFTNLPELQTLYRSFADVITSEMVQLDVPEAKKHVINLKPSDTVIDLAEKIAERAEIIHNGGVKPEIDNMLKVTSDGKKLALDPRCFVPDSEDVDGSKLNEAAQRIYEIWEDTTDKKGTQIVFCDLSTPKVRSEEYIYGLRFDAYNDLKYKLVQKGIPADEIAFIHDANTDEQKQALFDRVNSGSIRVLIGSTEKCGAGTNVQKRLLALHHLDTPYRPSDMEQREGRIIRQGNTNDTVDIYTYVMERTFDSYSYQILENKSRFIQQITRGDFTAREFEDIDETTLSYAEIKAITAANPRIKRKMEVDTEIARLRVLDGQYKKNLYALQDKIRKDFPEDIRKQELLIERVTLDLMHLQASKPKEPEAFVISVNGKVYTDRKEGGKALTDALYASKPEKVVAEYCGFKLCMNPMKSLTGEREITLMSSGQYIIGVGESSSGNLTRLDNFIEDFSKRKERLENRLTQLKSDLAIAEEQVQKPFEHREHLAELIKEQAELNAELNLDKREESAIIDDGNDSGNKDNYKMLPTQERHREEKIIDEEDMVALMIVDVLPDYRVDAVRMHKYGYLWDGMLPLTRNTALRLWGMGLQIYKLNDDNTHTGIRHYGDFKGEKENIYGIEKPVWKNFMDNEKSTPYFAARSQFAEAAGVVASGEMSAIDERFTIDFIETNYAERADLDEYLATKPKPDGKAMASYAVQMLDEFSERIWRDELKNYGWEEADIKKSIAKYLEDDELKAETKQLTNIPFNPEKELMKMLNSRQDYREAVVSSVGLEYDAFIKEMLNSAPQEVLNNHYKVHCFERLSSVIEEDTEYFSDEDYKALYEDRGQILDKIYDDFIFPNLLESNEPTNLDSYDDTVNCIKKYCRENHKEIYEKEEADTNKETTENKAVQTEPTERIKTQPVYLETWGYAEKHGELEDYRNSHTLSEECKYAIDEAIRNNFDGMHLKSGFEDGLIQKYGIERIAYLLATTIRAHDYDGRYSHANKEWANSMRVSASENERNDCCLNIHPAVLDGFTDRIREKQIILYTTIKEENADGKPCYNAYSLDKESGEVKFLLGDFGSDLALQATVDQDAASDHKGYVFKRIEPQELNSMSEKIKAKYKDKEEKKKNETPRAIEKLKAFVESGDNITPVYYYFISELIGGGKEQYQVYLLNYGDDEIYPFFKNGFTTQDELEREWNKINEKGIYSSVDFHKSEPPQMLRMRNHNKENKEDKMAQDKYLHFTARGDKVLSIVKDRDDRNIAIIQREKMGDFVVAARYDTTDGTWGAAKYDFTTLEEAEKYRQEKYGFENTSDTVDKKWLTCKVSPEALIKKYQFNSRFMMPKDSGYEGYAYSIFNDRIKEGTITADLKSDTRERALVIRIPDNQNVELSGNGKTVEIEPHEFISLVNETTSDKYEREQRYTVGFPPEAFIKEYDTSMLVAMPNDTKYKGYVYYLPKSVISEDKHSDNGTLIANIGESFKITLRKGEEKIELTAKEYLELVGDKKADRYKREPSELDEYRQQQGEDDKKWNTVAICENAVIANYKETTLFKMPKGDYAGYVYYIPSGMVRKEDDGLYLRVPEDFTAHLKNGDEKKDLTAQEFIAEIEGKTDEDYESIYRKPSEEAVKQFEKIEGQLRRNVPAEMLNKPNWIVVRTRENNETGRLDKFLINPHTGKFAESDNPETWSDFDTACKYAKENGGVCLAYALEWDSDIACIDLDGCMQENGDFSEIAEQTFNAAKGSYCERSVSGKGLHIFGKTKGADLRSFSKDKTMEYYQGGHFIAMTGDYYGSSELKSFDTPMMMNVLESKLEKRTEWKNTGKGVEGLSSMDDREMLNRAFAAKNGDTVKRLYNGEDLRGNHSNSDMSLMNYLAFWSNHDIDQMLRVFSSSGLYRADKPQSYYEHTAIKAVKGTPCYTPPKASNNKPSGSGNGSGKDGK